MAELNTQKKILIMAGGTGGHVFPALSIARCLQAQGAVVEWLGTAAGLEARVVPEAKIPFHTVSINGLRGKGFVRKLLSPFRIARAMWQSASIMRRIAPDCVLGMGGFVTGPGGVSARLLRKPLVIHEQNAIAGFSNLMLLPLANVVMEAFPDAFKRKRQMMNSLLRVLLPGKNKTTTVVGNPVRREISNLLPPEQKASNTRTHILILGGSLGARVLNELIPQVLANFSAEDRPVVLHQCGDKNLDDTLKAYREANLDVTDDEENTIRVASFIDNMAQAYSWADIVICRSGALTVAELAAAGVASILVPYPHAVDDHQTENAHFLVQHEAARLIPSSSLNLQTLLPMLTELLASPALILQMARNARGLARGDADSVVAGVCLEACHD